MQDSDKTWNTYDPRFTECFELTILVWFPCLLLFVFAPLDIYYIKKSKYANIPWGFTNIVRLVIPALLICLCIADMVMGASLRNEFNLQNVHMVTPAVKLLTFVSFYRLLDAQSLLKPDHPFSYWLSVWHICTKTMASFHRVVYSCSGLSCWCLPFHSIVPKSLVFNKGTTLSVSSILYCSTNRTSLNVISKIASADNFNLKNKKFD